LNLWLSGSTSVRLKRHLRLQSLLVADYSGAKPEASALQRIIRQELARVNGGEQKYGTYLMVIIVRLSYSSLGLDLRYRPDNAAFIEN
jgi:hypothetical protein